jgi:hypothetical protein
VKEFEFVEAGQTFYCSVETPRLEGMAPWWWFRLDSSGSTRYAPFEASASDTEQSVRRRIIAYYAELLAIQARPAYQRPAWRKPEPAGTAAPGAPASNGAAQATPASPAPSAQSETQNQQTEVASHSSRRY